MKTLLSHPSVREVLFVGAILLLMNACSGDPSVGSVERSLENEIEVVTIRNFTRSILSSIWQIDSLFSIGTAYGEDVYQLNNPSNVAVDQAGHIFLGDWGNRRILKFDNNGNWLLTIGRHGQGPGEIETEIPNLGGIALWLDEQLVVTDQRQNRFLIFDAQNGASIRTELLMIGSVSGPIVALNNERIVLQKLRFRDISMVLMLDYELNPVDTLATAPLDPWQATSVSSQIWRPFYPMQIWAHDSRGHVVIGDGSKYSFDWYNSEGRIVKSLRVDWLDQHITEEDRRLVREGIRSNRYSPRDRNEANAREILFPENKPVSGRIFFDDRDRLWIEHYRPPFSSFSPGEEILVYDIFSADLEPLGQVSTNHAIEAVANDRVYYFGMDSDGAEILIVGSLVQVLEHH